MLLTFGLSLPSWAQTLLISDIDDTIKISHVLDWSDSLFNATRTGNEFLGMSQAYEVIQESLNDVKFAYVSAAPANLMTGWHRDFLTLNGFPEGSLFLKESSSDTDMKLRIIRILIAHHNPQRLILIGDNGEADIKIYKQIANENKTRTVFTYIHQIYSTKNSNDKGQVLEAGQIAFVTSVDLIQDLFRKKLIAANYFTAFNSFAIPKIQAISLQEEKGRIAFPRWMDCRDFSLPGLDKEEESLSPLLKNYQNLLKGRCLRKPLFQSRIEVL